MVYTGVHPVYTSFNPILRLELRAGNVIEESLRSILANWLKMIYKKREAACIYAASRMDFFYFYRLLFSGYELRNF